MFLINNLPMQRIPCLQVSLSGFHIYIHVFFCIIAILRWCILMTVSCCRLSGPVCDYSCWCSKVVMLVSAWPTDWLPGALSTMVYADCVDSHCMQLWISTDVQLVFLMIFYYLFYYFNNLDMFLHFLWKTKYIPFMVPLYWSFWKLQHERCCCAQYSTHNRSKRY